MSRFTARGLLFHILVPVLLFFSQHAMAQRGPCSASEMATYNFLRQRYLACVQQFGVNGFFDCSVDLANRLNGVSPICLQYLNMRQEQQGVPPTPSQVCVPGIGCARPISPLPGEPTIRSGGPSPPK